MAHEVENMMYVGATPWHRLGTKLDNPPTTAEAMVAAGLNWTVDMVPVMTDDGTMCRGFKAVQRSTDGRVLGVLKDYTPLQNHEAFSFFDPFLASGEASLETAGSLRDGQRIWIMAKLNRDPISIVGSDTVDKYLFLSNSHDGSLAVSCGFTPVRIVCANTLAMAHGDVRTKSLRVKHSANVKANVDAIRDIVNTANQAFEATADQYRLLARSDIHAADVEKYVEQVFRPQGNAAPESDDATVARLLGKQESDDATVARLLGKPRALEPIQKLLETGRGAQLPGARGTLWGIYNATTEYLQHERGNDAAARFDSAMLGQGKATNDRALAVALKMATA